MSLTTLPIGVLETLRQDDEWVLYRCADCVGRPPLLMLAPAAGELSTSSLQRLEQEWACRNDLDPAWAARPVERVDQALLLSDPGGELLSRLVGRPWEPEPFIRVAIGIATAMGRMHERGLIHKDIKPANILVDTRTGEAWFTGFSIATRLPREHQMPAAHEVIAGTLAYMAPEQTGRMNRSIDSRSDLYALGVTLYELLAGTLPFNATDPIEWIHCHIARRPAAPIERVPEVPGALSAIVMRLLAKTLEERYQTAAGVEADLRRWQAAWMAGQQIDPFPLGQQDASGRLLIPERLYGRDAEIATLRAAFERVTKGGSALVLVSGYSGIGKSSVVNELHKVIVLPRGIFISGKFDQRLRDVPYATFAQAFRGLMHQIPNGGEDGVRRWREDIRRALGDQGGLLTDLMPELAQVVGPQPQVPAARSAMEATLRFQTVFQRFIGVFARAEHPLVIFIDDLQWLDPATLTLIEYLAQHPDTHHLLLIGAYRDNEVDPSHPLLLTLARIREAGASIDDIVLGPLSVDDVSRLVADAVRADQERTWPLAELVHRNTGGNPFFVGQFLTSLVEDGLLLFDPHARSWNWDLPGIDAKGFTDNLVELMIRRLWRLPGATQHALQQLACLGSQADFATLGMVHGDSAEDMHADFRAAVPAGAILIQEDQYRFLHDRVQEAAYALIPVEERAERHLAIGRALLRNMAPDTVAEKIFVLVSQLNLGLPLVADWSERQRVVELDLLAARRAKAATAYSSACGYLAAAMEALGNEGWRRCHDLAVSLWLERADCELHASNVELAGRLVDEVLPEASSKIDRAEAYRLRMVIESLRGELATAVSTGLECLRMFGIELPECPTSDHVQAAFDDLRRDLGDRSIASLIDLPRTDDPEVGAAMQSLTMASTVSFLTDANLHRVIVCRAVKLTLQHGTNDFSAIAYGVFGIVIGPVFHRFDDGERFARLSVDLARRHGFVLQAENHLLLQMALLWTRPIQEALDCLEAGMQSARKTGEVVYACYTLEHRLVLLLERGDSLDAVWQESTAALEFVKKWKFQQVIDFITAIRSFIQSLRGQANAGATLAEEDLDSQLLGGGVPVIVCSRWILCLRRHFLLGDAQTALRFAQSAEPILWPVQCLFQSVNHCLYQSLALATVFPTVAPDEQSGMRETLAANLRALQRWNESCPETFSHKHALVAAEIARIDGRDMDALRLYELAIRSASEHGFVQYQALANELAGRFCHASGLEKVATGYLREARECYVRWGASAKVAQLDRSHPGIGQPTAPPTSSIIDASFEQLDLATIVRMSQTLSEDIVLASVIETLMTLAVEYAGAELGFLVLCSGDEQQVQAQASTESGGVKVKMLQTRPAPVDHPDSVFRHVARTREGVILDDARRHNAFSEDEYIRRERPRSILCLPLLKRAELVGIVYLENKLTSHAFTPAQYAVLRLLSSQAAISLQNAKLYSERTRAEEALRQSEERYALALAGSDESIFDWDMRTDRVYLAPRTQELQGLPPGDVWRAREEWRRLLPVHADDMFLMRAAMDAHLAGKVPMYDVEVRIVLPGEVRWVHRRGRALRDGEGRAYRVTGSIRDITERKRGQAEMLRLEGRLRQAERFEAMGTLAGGIAHDFNNILGGILGHGERALRGADKDTRLRRDLESIVVASKRGRALVNRILAFSGGSVGERVVVHVEKVVREALDLLQATLTTGTTLNAKLRAGRAAILGDPTQVHQVVMNLGSNAMQAMPEGGTLWVSLDAAHFETSRSANVGMVGAGDWLVLKVSDSGIGIAPDTVERIFDPFFTTNETGVGTGLGLSLVMRIVTEAGGAIGVASTPGSGSVFTVYLPRAGDAPEDLEDAKQHLPQGNGQRVIVVDDDELLLGLTTETLAELGYEPVGFSSGIEALNAFRADPQGFDALVTDERMPGMHGSTLIVEVRLMRPAMPALLMGGDVVPVAGDRGDDDPFDQVLRKPLTTNELATSLTRLFRRSR